MQFSEEFLYHIWDAQHLKNNLTTVSGKNLLIKFPGRWNTDSGPDFKDAIIELEGEILKGDIEIDIKAYNWKSHSHIENPEFNSVLLHIVFENNGQHPYTISENGNKVEILEIKDQLDENISKLIEHYSGKSYSEKEKKCKLFNKMSILKTKELLNQFGLIRFEKKIKRFTAEHYFSSFDQLLYMGLMEALGYSKNKYQMLQLAMNLPFDVLKRYYLKGMTINELNAMLFCSNDLIDHLPAVISNENKKKWQLLFKKQNSNDHNIDIDIKWKLFRIRPVNHPAIRILQSSNIIYNSLETSFFHEVLKLFSVPTKKFKISDFKKRLYNFFQTDKVDLPQNYKLGKTRIDTILINIILPLAVVYAREKQYNKLEQVIFEIYQNYPGLPSNYLTKYMEKFLNTDQKKIIRKHAVNQQGILNIYYENCQHHYCEACLKKEN